MDDDPHRRALRAFASSDPPPPDPPPQPRVPLHSLTLPSSAAPTQRSLPPSAVYCEHLVARALGEPTLVEVPFPQKDEVHDRKGKAVVLPTPADFFACNLCLEVATEPVITPCGHLFCWPCLFISVRIAGGCCSIPCAVCGSAVEIGAEGNVVPIYGRGAEGEGERHPWVPARPRARRTERARGKRPPAVEWLENSEWSDSVRRRVRDVLEDVRRFEGEPPEAEGPGPVFAEQVLDDVETDGNAGGGAEVDGMGELVQIGRRRRRLF